MFVCLFCFCFCFCFCFLFLFFVCVFVFVFVFVFVLFCFVLVLFFPETDVSSLSRSQRRSNIKKMEHDFGMSKIQD